MHQRSGAARTQKADRLPRVWGALHARESIGRSHGFFRGSVRSLLPLSAARGRQLGVMRMAERADTIAELSCPAPLRTSDTVLLGHGSGGKLTAELIRDVFLPALNNPVLSRLDDQAIVNVCGQRLAFTTDSFVVKPLFFPGGDIGSLAVHGTINDLAMGGATP